MTAWWKKIILLFRGESPRQRSYVVTATEQHHAEPPRRIEVEAKSKFDAIQKARKIVRNDRIINDGAVLYEAEMKA